MGVLGDWNRLRLGDNQFGTYGGLTNQGGSGVNWGWTGSFKPNAVQPTAANPMAGYGAGTTAAAQRPQHPNEALNNQLAASLSNSMANPGIDEKTIQQMISRGADQAANSNVANRIALMENANANGGSLGGGGFTQALDEMNTRAALQRQGIARDAKIAQGQSQVQDRQHAQSLTDQYLGRLVGQQESNYRYDQDRNDRMAQMRQPSMSYGQTMYQGAGDTGQNPFAALLAGRRGGGVNASNLSGTGLGSTDPFLRSRNQSGQGPSTLGFGTPAPTYKPNQLAGYYGTHWSEA